MMDDTNQDDAASTDGGTETGTNNEPSMPMGGDEETTPEGGDEAAA